jgi:hypothetical protein
MESNPEEFYGKAAKWAFMFEPNFRDVMTEPEKGALHEALKDVRRKEFDELVIRRMLQDEANEKMEQMRTSGGVISRGQVTTAINDVFGQAYPQQNTLTGTGILNSYNPALNSVNPYK